MWSLIIMKVSTAPSHTRDLATDKIFDWIILTACSWQCWYKTKEKISYIKQGWGKTIFFEDFLDLNCILRRFRGQLSTHPWPSLWEHCQGRWLCTEDHSRWCWRSSSSRSWSCSSGLCSCSWSQVPVSPDSCCSSSAVWAAPVLPTCSSLMMNNSEIIKYLKYCYLTQDFNIFAWSSLWYLIRAAV